MGNETSRNGSFREHHSGGASGVSRPHHSSSINSSRIISVESRDNDGLEAQAAGAHFQSASGADSSSLEERFETAEHVTAPEDFIGGRQQRPNLHIQPVSPTKRGRPSSATAEPALGNPSAATATGAAASNDNSHRKPTDERASIYRIEENGQHTHASTPTSPPLDADTGAGEATFAFGEHLHVDLSRANGHLHRTTSLQHQHHNQSTSKTAQILTQISASGSLKQAVDSLSKAHLPLLLFDSYGSILAQNMECRYFWAAHTRHRDSKFSLAAKQQNKLEGIFLPETMNRMSLLLTTIVEDNTDRPRSIICMTDSGDDVQMTVRMLSMGNRAVLESVYFVAAVRLFTHSNSTPQMPSRPATADAEVIEESRKKMASMYVVREKQNLQKRYEDMRRTVHSGHQRRQKLDDTHSVSSADSSISELISNSSGSNIIV